MESRTDLNLNTVSADVSFSLFFFFSSESSFDSHSGVPLFDSDTKKESLEDEDPFPRGTK